MPTQKKPALDDMDKLADDLTENKEEKDEIKGEGINEMENQKKPEPVPEEKPAKKTKAKTKKATKKGPVKKQSVKIEVVEEEKPKKKKVGRKASRPGCTEKIYFTTTPEIRERIKIALLQEQIKETKKGNSLFDQSCFLENAVLDYLKRKKY